MHSTGPTRYHLSSVARELKSRLNGKAFLTLPRMEMTDMLRSVSELEKTRIKKNLADELEQCLLRQGVRCFPSLQETTTGDTVRLFHADSVLSGLMDLVIYPSVETDKDLGTMLRKIKGQWQWSTPTGPTAVIETVGS